VGEIGSKGKKERQRDGLGRAGGGRGEEEGGRKGGKAGRRRGVGGVKTFKLQPDIENLNGESGRKRVIVISERSRMKNVEKCQTSRLSPTETK
jgi:hypothetical protein